MKRRGLRRGVEMRGYGLTSSQHLDKLRPSDGSLHRHVFVAAVHKVVQLLLHEGGVRAEVRDGSVADGPHGGPARVQEFEAVRDGFGGDKIKRAAHAAVHGHHVSNRHSPRPRLHVACKFERTEHQIAADVADNVAGGGRARVPLVKARAAEMRLAAQEALKIARAVRAPVPHYVGRLSNR